MHWAEAAHIEFLGIMITCIAIDLAPKFSSCYRYLLQTLPDAMWASPPAASASTWSPARLLGTENVRVRGPSGLAAGLHDASKHCHSREQWGDSSPVHRRGFLSVSNRQQVQRRNVHLARILLHMTHGAALPSGVRNHRC